MLQQPGDLREFAAVEDAVHDGGQEVQGLAAEKIHGAQRFEEERGRCRHTARHDGFGNPFEQREIIRGEGLSFGTQGKGMPESGSEIVGATGEQSG